MTLLYALCKSLSDNEVGAFLAFDACLLSPMQTNFVGMMQYDGDLKLPARFLVPPPAISGTSGEILAKNGISTFACSETQKFGHVSPIALLYDANICSHPCPQMSSCKNLTSTEKWLAGA